MNTWTDLARRIAFAAVIATFPSLVPSMVSLRLTAGFIAGDAVAILVQ